jgi:hypothetical protein
LAVTFWPTAWPVPMPLVVQPAAAIAINEAPAILIEKAFIVLLLYSPRKLNGGITYLLPRLNSSLRLWNTAAAKFMTCLAFFAAFGHRRRAGARDSSSALV